jgi:hypothetical protein
VRIRHQRGGAAGQLRQQLVYGAVRLGDGNAVIHDPGKIGIGEGNFSEGSVGNADERL